MTHINLAGDSDVEKKVSSWAKLFKAKTWEEIKMIAEENKDVARAASSAYQLLKGDAKIFEEMRIREDEQLFDRTVKEAEDAKKEIDRLISKDQKTQKELAAKDEELNAKDAEISRLLARIKELESK